MGVGEELSFGSHDARQLASRLGIGAQVAEFGEPHDSDAQELQTQRLNQH